MANDDSPPRALHEETADIPAEIDLPIRSPAIERLIEEMRNEGRNGIGSYNRVYSRHHRS